MITSLRLRNFKGIRRADIGLERLTVIVGPNASGKTSFLEGLHYLSRMGVVGPKKVFRGRSDPLLLYRRDAAGEEMELACSRPEGGIRLLIVPPGAIINELPHPLQASDGWNFRFEGKEEGGTAGIWRAIDEIPAVARMFRPAARLYLDVSCMSNPSESIGKRIGMNGNGLAPVLAFMALNQPDDFQQIQQRLKSVVPTLERIRFDRASRDPSNAYHITIQELKKRFPKRYSGIDSSRTYAIVFDFRGARNIPAHLASEGTMLILGLLTALMVRGRPNLVLLDDIERGLHPKAQREVVGLLRTILDQNPELQIVATTHSPYLVDSLRPEEVRLTTLDEDGTVSCAGLVDHPDFDKWKDEMAPGEMWSLFGEKWVGDLQKDAGVK